MIEFYSWSIQLALILYDDNREEEAIEFLKTLGECLKIPSTKINDFINDILYQKLNPILVYEKYVQNNYIFIKERNLCGKS